MVLLDCQLFFKNSRQTFVNALHHFSSTICMLHHLVFRIKNSHAR